MNSAGTERPPTPIQTDKDHADAAADSRYVGTDAAFLHGRPPYSPPKQKPLWLAGKERLRAEDARPLASPRKIEYSDC